MAEQRFQCTFCHQLGELAELLRRSVAFIFIVIIKHRAGGSGIWTPPQVFRNCLKNGGAYLRRFWHTSSYIFSAHVKISDPIHSRSGHQVTSHLTSEKMNALSYTESPITLKLSAIDIRNSIYKMSILKF